jgi:hypothetical protein
VGSKKLERTFRPVKPAVAWLDRGRFSCYPETDLKSKPSDWSTSWFGFHLNLIRVMPNADRLWQADVVFNRLSLAVGA